MKLVGLLSHCKAEVHVVLAKCGGQVLMSDLFGAAGTELLDGLDLPAPHAARIASLRRLMDDLDFEVDLLPASSGAEWPTSRGTPRCRRSRALVRPWAPPVEINRLGRFRGGNASQGSKALEGA